MPEGQRPRPQPTPETMHFWEGTRAGELRLQRCNSCSKVYFPPRPFCRIARRAGLFSRQRPGQLYSCDPPPTGAGLHPPYAIAVVDWTRGRA